MPGRFRAIVAVALIAGLAGPALSQEAGRITRVVLYPGSAAIERSARVAAGASKVEMTGLPANFDLRTLRVEADAGIVVGEVAVHDVSRAEALSGRESELEGRIEALKDEKAALEVEVKTAELVRNYLASLSSRGGETEKSQPMVLDPKAIPAVIEAIRRGGGDAYGQIQRVEIKKRGIDKQLAVLERDLARLRSGGRDVRTLAISYSASRAGEVRATYQVTNAGWKPAYRAALDSSSSRVELERQATIVQRTGEDWRGVALRLSTGQPRAAQIVDPATWQLVLRAPVQAGLSSSDVRSPAAPAAMLERRAMADEGVIVDSAMDFEQAVAGTAATPEVLDRLRLIDVRYCGFDRRRHQGQLVIHSELAEELQELFQLMEQMRFPVARVVPIVCFGWSDEASMAADNSSAFNYRLIAGTDRLSRHALGRAVDINPRENPAIYPDNRISPAGAVRQPEKPGTLTREHPVVRAFQEKGWRWGGEFTNLLDYHHFEKG